MWKPGKQFPGAIDRASESANEAASFVFNPNNRQSLQQQRNLLPVYKLRTEILYVVHKYRVTIIVGETGCGKTTQIPQYLYEAGWCNGGKMIACTQPRRVAATSVAHRVAEETGTLLGNEVGYAIRFDDKWSQKRTKIKYMTDGMLLREMMIDPLLSAYSVIIIIIN